eukprot:symbB.v1.2.038069.t1/scaffold5808.1/size23464/1
MEGAAEEDPPEVTLQEGLTPWIFTARRRPEPVPAPMPPQTPEAQDFGISEPVEPLAIAEQ